MKRMIIRLSALTTVIALGAFAVVAAQRSQRAAAEAAAASGEPAELVVDQSTVKPMPQPTSYDAPRDRYAAAGSSGEVVDPFSANSAATRYEHPVVESEPIPEAAAAASQGIPAADEAMRRYDARAGERSRSADPNVRPLGYDESALIAAGQSPDDVNLEAAPAPMSARNEPTLAPPRGGDRYAATTGEQYMQPEMELPSEAPAGELVPEPADANFAPTAAQSQPAAGAHGSSRQPAAAGRYGAAAAREPALLPTDAFDDRAAAAPRGADNFAPLPAREALGGQAEGAGRPGAKQLEGPQAPHLVVEKAAPAEMQVGKPAVIVLKIRNTGSVPASHVEVHDQVPKGTQLVSTTPQAEETATGEVVWSLGSLKPGEETSAEMELMPVAEGEIGSVATVHFAAESSMRTLVTKPVVNVEIDAPREVLQGEDVKMHIKVANNGTGAATGLMLREVVPEQLQHPAGPDLEYEIGTLKPGETRELDLTMHAVKAGHVVNAIAAVGEGSVRVDQQAEFEVIAAQLVVSMEGPARRYLDRQASYTISVSNPGTAAAREVSLVTHLPPGLKFVEANNAGQYNPQTRTVEWLLDELPPNDAGSVQLVTVAVEPGEHLVRIDSSAERGLTAQEEKTITVEGVAAINFSVVDVADPVEVGGETAYEIKVVNQGTKAATNVRVVALFPDELTPIGAEGPSRYSIDGQRVLFDGLAQLAPKADTTYRVRAQGRGAGDVRVRVQVLTDEIRTPVTKEESTRVYADE